MSRSNPKPSDLGLKVLVREEGGEIRLMREDERSVAPSDHTHFIISRATAVR